MNRREFLKSSIGAALVLTPAVKLLAENFEIPVTEVSENLGTANAVNFEASSPCPTLDAVFAEIYAQDAQVRRDYAVFLQSLEN
jgi:hypothetical protein